MVRLFVGDAEAAKYLGCCTRTIRRLRREGKLPTPTAGGKIGVWDSLTLDAFRCNLRPPHRPPALKCPIKGTEVKAVQGT